MTRPGLEDTMAAPATPTSGPAHTETVPGSGEAAREPGDGLAAGQQLGHFRIEKPLGAGGMGEVYLATDLALDRPVAVKVLPAEVALDPVRRDRMIREARAQARVVHPNVAHIYFIGEEQGRLFFAMELIGGANLADRIAAGPMSAEEAIAIIREAALGLREAHRQGYTHRDVKPSNLMIDSHGVVKVLDFGLAAGAPGGAVTAGPVAQTSLAGTPLYMSPEQARGEPVDCRADIYALGATLFHLVSGQPPFQAESAEALLSKHASAERPVLPRRSGVARATVAAIDALCTRMMALDPVDRFASYDELLRALELASVEHARPAGLWVRTIATVVDFGLVTVCAILIAVLAELAKLIGGDISGGPLLLGLYGIYVIFALRRFGRTVGQSLLELEVVDLETGGRPSARQAALRVAIPLALPAAAIIIRRVLGWFDYDLYNIVRQLMMVAMLWVPPALIYATLRVPGKLTVWDKRSRTMVRYRGGRPVR